MKLPVERFRRRPEIGRKPGIHADPSEVFLSSPPTAAATSRYGVVGLVLQVGQGNGDKAGCCRGSFWGWGRRSIIDS